MLVKCPRCGFSQPKDQYCAQCGIDMVAFKPPREPLLKRIATSPFLYLSIALLLIGLSVTTLYKRDKTDISQRVKFLKGSLQIASTNGQEGARAETAAASADTSAETTLKEVPIPSPSLAPTGTPSPTATIVPPGTTTAYIYYTEVPRQSLERLYEESQATGQFNSFGDYTAGILPDVQNRIAAPGLKIRVLEKSEKTIAKNQQWFSGINDPEFDEDLGLSTFIELTESDNSIFRGNLEIVRNLREVDDRSQPVTTSPQKNSYPAIFEFGTGSGFFVAGILPRKARLAQEENLSRKGPFEILRSAAFQNRESEFVIFIVFEKKP